MPLQIGQLTDVGLVRSINEDAILVDERHGVFVLADGMGGHKAGEEASRLAVNIIGDYLANRDPFEMVASKAALSKDHEPPLLDVIEKSISKANQMIFREAQEEEFSGMGTTVIVGVIQGDYACFGFVGDSRAYLISQGTIQQLSEDHSLVAQLVKNSSITPEEALHHPYKNVITRSLGTSERVQADLLYVKIEAEDQILLCSDGLTNMISDAEILRVVSASGGPQEGCDNLVALANKNGGTDNISVILIKL